MVHGEKYIQALWCRNTLDLWRSLSRIMIPLYLNENKKEFLLTVTPLILPVLPLFLLTSLITFAGLEKYTNTGLAMMFLALVSILLLVANNMIQPIYVLFQNLIYSLAIPLSGTFMLISFVSSIVKSKQGHVISWRGKKYSLRMKNKNKYQ